MKTNKDQKDIKELIDAAKMLRDYCEDHGTGCDGCVFDYDRGTRCRIGNYVVPERWPLVYPGWWKKNNGEEEEE